MQYANHLIETKAGGLSANQSRTNKTKVKAVMELIETETQTTQLKINTRCLKVTTPHASLSFSPGVITFYELTW